MYGIVINFLLSLGSSAWAWHHCSGRQTLSDGSDWFIEEEKEGSRTQCFQVVWSYTSSWNSVQRRLWRMLCGVLLSMLFGQDFLACHRTRCILQTWTTLWTVDGRLENNFFFVRIYIHFTYMFFQSSFWENTFLLTLSNKSSSCWTNWLSALCSFN